MRSKAGHGTIPALQSCKTTIRRHRNYRPERKHPPMALLQLLSEEPIAEDRIHEYFEDLYRVVCVGERPESTRDRAETVRSTYVVDWEQLVHLLEDYSVFGEDIVEVTRVRSEDARVLRHSLSGSLRLARA